MVQLKFLDGVATFELSVIEVVEGISMRAYCEDEGDFAKAAMSDKFSIHAFPKTGLLQETDTGFTYKGSAEYVSTVLEAFETLLKGKKADPIQRNSVAAALEVEKMVLTPEEMAMWPEF